MSQICCFALFYAIVIWTSLGFWTAGLKDSDGHFTFKQFIDKDMNPLIQPGEDLDL